MDNLKEGLQQNVLKVTKGSICLHKRSVHFTRLPVEQIKSVFSSSEEMFSASATVKCKLTYSSSQGQTSVLFASGSGPESGSGIISLPGDSPSGSASGANG